MPVAEDIQDGLRAPNFNARYGKVSVTSEGAATWHSLWKVGGGPIAAATPPSGNGEIPTDATVGAMPIDINAGAGNHLALAHWTVAGTTQGQVDLVDRVFHNSGFVGNSTLAQTLTQPALTRYTDGVGVEVWLEVYTAMGATGSVFTVTGVDANGDAATWVYTMPANALTVGQMVKCIPQTAGAAKGCRSVSQVQLSANTGTAGNFGITLMAWIATAPLDGSALPGRVLDWAMTGLAPIENDACLAMVVFCTTTNTGYIYGSLKAVELAD